MKGRVEAAFRFFGRRTEFGNNQVARMKHQRNPGRRNRGRKTSRILERQFSSRPQRCARRSRCRAPDSAALHPGYWSDPFAL